MTKKINNFEDLIVWQRGHSLAVKVYLVTQKFPKEELYGIVSQLRRSASSVPANIVEGYYRDTTKELIKFLYNARGSAGEVVYFLMLSNELKYLGVSDFTETRSEYELLLKQISALINSLKKR